MVDQEHYWTAEALQEILRRAEFLSNEDPEEALRAARSAVEILERRLVEPATSLQVRVIVVLGSMLRINGNLEEALQAFEHALRLAAPGSADRSRVLMRMTVTLVYLNRIEAALEAVNEALRLTPRDPFGLAARGWVYFVVGDFSATIRDCSTVLEQATPESSSDHSFISSIVNIAESMSYEAGSDVEPEVLQRVQEAIRRYRETLATKGSQFYKVQRLRLMLSRAEALVLARLGDAAQAIPILHRVIRGLRPKLSDDALDASVDLMCLLAKEEDEEAAAAEARRTLEIANETKNPPGLVAMTVLKNSAKKQRLSLIEAVEIRVRLRSPS